VRLFKKKKLNLSMLDVASRLRGFILDTQIQKPHEMAELLGLSPISDEVADREEEESDIRVERIAHLIPLVYTYAHSLAEGSIEVQKNSADNLDGLPEEIWMVSRRMMEQVAMSAMLGSIAQLVDMNLLEIPNKKGRR
jgi:hypothetical protein